MPGAWQGLSAAELVCRWAAPEVHAFSRVGSTNDVARRLALSGAPDRTVIVAEEQSVGRGRLGRGWSSAPGLGLWLSVIARPPASAGPDLLPLLVGLAAARALDDLVPPPGLRLKWPNDLLVEDRKVAGILCEAVWAGAQPAFVVVGMGINVLHGVEDFPPEIRDRATSLRHAGAGGVSPLEVSDRVVPALLEALDPAAPTPDALWEDLSRRDALLGRTVVISDPAIGKELARGEACGIGRDGTLRLRVGAGEILSLRSGTVQVLGENETRR